MKTLVNAKEFSDMYGFPLSVVRRLCREGRIPCWDFRTRYLMEPEAAYNALLALQGPGSLSRQSGNKGAGYGFPAVPVKRHRVCKRSSRDNVRSQIRDFV